MECLLKKIRAWLSPETGNVLALKNLSIIMLVLLSVAVGLHILEKCQNIALRSVGENSWKEKLQKRLPLLGHRNWILIVDKAFPLQSSPGIQYLDTKDSLLTVLDFAIKEIKKSEHLQPAFYLDKELGFIPQAWHHSLQKYRTDLRDLLKTEELKVMSHDSVFRKVDATSKLFTVLILKTKETIPYSSVFIELGCKYWDQEKEDKLRLLIKDSLKTKN